MKDGHFHRIHPEEKRRNFAFVNVVSENVGFLICLNWVQMNICTLSKEMRRSLKTRNATKINQVVDLCLAHSGNTFC